MKNKRGGVIGSFIGMFIMTIVVFIILVIFIFSSGIVKKINKSDDGVVFYDELDIGLVEILDYSLKYETMVETRFLVADGFTVDDAFSKAEEVLMLEEDFG